MDEKIRIVVDAMGGDNAPEAPVHGAVDALAENNKIEITLVGRAEEVQAELAKYSYDESRVQIVNAEDVIGFDEPPVEAIRKKKDSSIVVGQKGRGGCVCIGRKHRRDSGRRTACCRQDPRRGESTVSSAYPNDRRRISSDRLWCQCRCKSLSSGAVCKDGIHLYGEYRGDQESACGNRQHRCRGRKGECPG